MAALDQEDPRNVAIRQNEADARYMRQTTPGERAMDQRAAFNEASLRQRSEAAAARLGMEQQRVNIAEGRAGLSELRMKIAEEKARLAEADALSKAQRELTVMQEASGFLRDAVGMDPTKPSFDEQFQRMLAGYPNASESKSVKEWIDYHRPIAESRRAEQAKIAAEKRAADAAAAERARLAGIAPGMPVTQVVSDGVTRKMPDAAKPKEEKPDTWDAYEKALAAARKSLSIPVAKNAKDQIPLPPEIQAQFEARGTALTRGGAMPVQTTQPQFTVGNPNGTLPAIAPAAPAAASPSAIRMKYVDGKLVPAS
jgi:hypothetical protein